MEKNCAHFAPIPNHTLADAKYSWGYRRVDAVSLRLSVPGPSRPTALPKALTWVAASAVAAVSSIGTTRTCAQVHPGLMTPKLVELASSAVEVEVVRARAKKIVFRNDDDRAGVEAVELADGKRIPCSEVVIAAGPWIGSLVSNLLTPRLSKPLSGIRGSRAHSIVIKAPQPLSAHVLFTSLKLKNKSFEPEIYARPDGTAYVCGAGDGLALPDSAESVQVDPGRIAALKEQTAAISPDVLGNAEVVKEQACYLPISGSTGSPIIGRLTKGVTVAGGHSCWGITLGPGTGKCVAEIILQGEAKTADIDGLAP